VNDHNKCHRRARPGPRVLAAARPDVNFHTRFIRAAEGSKEKAKALAASPSGRVRIVTYEPV
jgi:hypothetical protein